MARSAPRGDPAGRARIAFLNNQGLDAIGGGVTILRHLVAALAPAHDVTVLSHDQPGAAPDGVRQIVLERPASPRGPLWRVAPLHRARQLARSNVPPALREADLVVALDPHFAGMLRRVKPRRLVYLSLSCVPRQEWFAASGGQAGLRFLQYAWLERRMARLAGRTVVASETHAAELRRWEAMPGLRPLVLHPAFPAESAPAPRRENATVTVLSAGRLERGKHLGAVLDLAAQLTDLPCRFVIAGGGPELGRLQARAAAVGVSDRVTFAGPVASLGPLLAEAGLFLHTSRYESFGIAPFEAMRAGVPPVCAKGDVIGCREIMQDGVDSVFVDFGRPGAVAALRHLVLDRPARERMGAAARATATRVLAQNYAARFGATLDEMLAR
ncbi:MAG TPA: glycosyltransferase family 4 protein [Acetobacteraceae bacterium]|nr:glycosyltransferase family 4 protein [Acetobacteraceae bacterium]